MKCRMLIALTVVMAAGSGCMAPKGGSAAEKRVYVNNMREDTLSRLYAKTPEAEARVENAIGYGVFAQIKGAALILGGGAGYGVVVDNETGVNSYMRMVQVSGGLGLGVKNLRFIFLFHTREALDKFIRQGWEVGTEARAVAAIDHDAADVGTTGSVTKGISVYQLAKDGLYLRAALHVKKFFPDTELNAD